MIDRHIKKAIDDAIKHFPCVLLTGPRQVGKTTLLIEKYENQGFSYVSLDNTSNRMLAKNNPKTFLTIHTYPLIIDEVQKVPELFEEIEYLINEAKKKNHNKPVNGMFILSGSSRKDLLSKVQDSLAGRVALFNMSPLSFSEILNRENNPFTLDVAKISSRSKNFIFDTEKILEFIVKGQMPILYSDVQLKGTLFYSFFIGTYLEQDVKTQIGLKDETKFYNLLILIASLTGQELKYDHLANQIGVSSITIKN